MGPGALGFETESGGDAERSHSEATRRVQVLFYAAPLVSFPFYSILVPTKRKIHIPFLLLFSRLLIKTEVRTVSNSDIQIGFKHNILKSDKL